jgi:MFS family permease
MLVAFLTVAIDLLGFGIVIPLLPDYAEVLLGDVRKELHGLTIGLLMASFSAMQFFFAPLWGRLSDHVGRRPVLLVGLGGSVAFYGLFAVASVQHSLALLFAARIGAGICGATIGTAQAVIADCTAPEKRAHGMALIGMAFGLGFTLGPVIPYFSLPAEGEATLSPVPGIIAASLSLIAFLIALLRLQETRSEAFRQSRPWLPLAGWKLVFARKATAIPVVVFFIATLAFANFEATLARYARNDMGLTRKDTCLLFAYTGFVLLLVQGMIVRRMVLRVGEVGMTLAGVTFMMAALVAMAILQGNAPLAVVLVGLAVAVTGFAFLNPSLQALVSRRSDPGVQGEILGVNQATSSIARILGPVMGNVLYGPKDGSHALPYYAAAGLLLVALLVGGAALRLPEQGTTGHGAEA